MRDRRYVRFSYSTGVLGTIQLRQPQHIIYAGDACSFETVTRWDTISADALDAAYRKAKELGMADICLAIHPDAPLPDVIPDGLTVLRIRGVCG